MPETTSGLWGVNDVYRRVASATWVSPPTVTVQYLVIAGGGAGGDDGGRGGGGGAGGYRSSVTGENSGGGASAETALSLLTGTNYTVTVGRTVPAAFTASETFDVGVDLGSPVALAYDERRPFKFDGKIESVHVELK